MAKQYSAEIINREVLTELPQAKIRFALHSAFVALTFLAHQFDSRIALPRVVVVSVAAMIAAAALFQWAVSLQRRNASIEERRVQRAVCLLSDNIFVTLVLFIGGASTAGLWAIYLWTSIGYGVRYGVIYLWVNVGLSTACFLTMAQVTSFWIAHPPFVLGMTLGMVLVPLYTGFLIRKLHEAVHERETAYRAKSEFLARMSHELRTPLHAIISSAELLRDSQQERIPNDYVDVIALSSNTLLELINRVLDLSKFESGDVGLVAERVNLAQLVGQVANLLYPQARSKGLLVEVCIESPIPDVVSGSRTHLREILLNLLGNAVKFTDEGSVKIAVSAEMQSSKSAVLSFRIEDTGCGIPADDLARIFEPFMQADTSKTRRHEGTGLGTSYARELIRLMDGEIAFHSAEGKGTVVSFHIPFKLLSLSPSVVPNVQHVYLLTAPGRLDWTNVFFAPMNSNPVVETSIQRLLEGMSNAQPDRRIEAVVVDVEPFSKNLADVIQSIKGASSGRLIPIAVIGDSASRTNALSNGASIFISRNATSANVQEALCTLVSLTGREDQEEELAPEARPAPRKSLRVLVADDNSTNRRIAQVALERAGHVCTLVDNGDEALFALNDDMHDVALLDMHMPKRHGIEVAKIYNFARFSDAVPTPIILLTADTTLETREEAASAGIMTFLTKPILPSEIVRVVEELGRHSDEPSPVHNLVGRAVSAHQVRHRQPQEFTSTHDLPTLDYPAVSELIALMEKTEQKKFFSDLAEDIDQYIQILRDAAIPADCRAVRDAMHALAGAAGIVGAVRLSRLAKLIETCEQGPLAVRREQFVSDLVEVSKETLAHIEDL